MDWHLGDEGMNEQHEALRERGRKAVLEPGGLKVERVRALLRGDGWRALAGGRQR